MKGKIRYFVLAFVASALLGGCSKSEPPRNLGNKEPTVESKQELEREELISEIEKILEEKPEGELKEALSEMEKLLGGKPKEDPILPQTEEQYLDEMIDYSLQSISKGKFPKAQELLKKETYDKRLNILRDTPGKEDAHKYFRDMREMILKRIKTSPIKADEAAETLDQILSFSTMYIARGNVTQARRFLKSVAYNKYWKTLADTPGNEALFQYFTDIRNNFLNRASGNYKDTIPSTGWEKESKKK